MCRNDQEANWYKDDNKKKSVVLLKRLDAK